MSIFGKLAVHVLEFYTLRPVAKLKPAIVHFPQGYYCIASETLLKNTGDLRIPLETEAGNLREWYAIIFLPGKGYCTIVVVSC